MGEPKRFQSQNQYCRPLAPTLWIRDSYLVGHSQTQVSSVTGPRLRGDIFLGESGHLALSHSRRLSDFVSGCGVIVGHLRDCSTPQQLHLPGAVALLYTCMHRCN